MPNVRILRDDGFGELVEVAMHDMAKGTAAPITQGFAPNAPAMWEFGAYTFILRKASRFSVLTVKSTRLPIPYHLLVAGEMEARRIAPTIASAFDAGGVPSEGVFSVEDLAKADGAPQRTLARPFRIVVRSQMRRAALTVGT